MPRYKYHCRECENTFIIEASIKEKSAGLDPVCPECESDNVYQSFSSVGVIGGSGGNNSGGCSTCPPGAGCC